MEQFSEISMILLVAFIVSTLMRYLKQPLVIGYILTGLIVGPYLLNILTSVEVVELFSKLGITALLFIVGLGLSPKVLKELGVVSTVTGVGQVLFTSLFGYLLGITLGFSTVEALYIAVALTFSSTIIILKLLSDKGDLHKLYGRIAVGFLLVQDLVATIILVATSGMQNLETTSSWLIISDLAILLIKGLALLVLLFFVSTKILTRLTDFIAKSQEFLFISSLAWGMAIASIYYKLGLSIEIGALVAGVTLSMTPYSYEISSRLKPLRDFFITLFFILLGYQMVLENWQALIVPTAVFSAFILIGNPIIVLVLMNLLGYTRKTGFLAGLTVAQISEFSLILIKLGHDVGHVSTEVMSMTTLIGITTIAGSTYMILYAEKLYKVVGKALALFEFRKSKRAKTPHDRNYDAIIFGYRRAGPEFAHTFREHGLKFLAVDYNPDTIHELEKLQIPAEYGDAADVEFLQELPIKEVKFIISTIPEYDANILLAQVISRNNPDAVIIVITDTMEHAVGLYSAGVTNVVLSHYIGARYAADMIAEFKTEKALYEKVKDDHLKYLTGIKELSLQK